MYLYVYNSHRELPGVYTDMSVGGCSSPMSSVGHGSFQRVRGSHVMIEGVGLHW